MTDDANGGSAPKDQHGADDRKVAWSDALPPEMPPPPPQPAMPRVPERNEPSVERTKLDPDALRDVFTKVTEEKEVKLQEELQSRPVVRAPITPPQVVENFTEASPCDSSWDKMTGTDRFRICAECKTHVYDFTSMEPPDVEKLVFQREARQCNFFFRRKDGRFMVNDCPVAVKRRATIAIAVAVVGVLVLGAIGTAVLSPPAPPPPGATLPAPSN